MPKRTNDDVPPDFDGDDELPPGDDLAPSPPPDDEPARPQAAAHAGGFVEYRGPDGAVWRCDRAAELFTDYTISGVGGDRVGKLEQWHRVMAPIAATWQTLRRLYRIAPLTGALQAADLREWSREEIAAELGVSAPLLESQLEGTRNFWQRVNLEKNLAEQIASRDGGLRELDEKKVHELLEKHGFSKVAEKERKNVAARIVEIGHLFELPEGRMLAQSAIFQELMIRHLQDQAADLLAQPKPDSGSLEKIYARLISAQQTYEKTLEKLGATQEQNPNFRRKVAFNDATSQYTLAMQKYYADNDTTLIDGIFTESEVLLQLTPTSLRPMQYRPDLVLLSQDWRANFWNPDYVAAKLPRGVMRRLLKGFEAGVRAQMVEEGEQPADMEDGGDEVLDMAETALASPVDQGAPTDDLTGAPGAVMPADDRRGGRGRDQVVCI